MPAPTNRTDVVGGLNQVDVTRATGPDQTVATLLSADKRTWGSCTLAATPERADGALVGGVKTAVSLYRTHVAFPKRVVGGVTSYDPPSQADKRIFSWDVDADPYVEVPLRCRPTDGDNSTPAYRDAEAKCSTFKVVWFGRRPAEVAAITIRNVDGVTKSANVKDGYFSYVYSAKMTPAAAAMIRRNGYPVAQVTFAGDAGQVLAQIHGGPRGLDSYPTLADTLKADLVQCPDGEPC